MAGRMMRMANGRAMIALTKVVIGKASLKGSIKGKIMMSSPVPMTKGEATKDRKLMPSISCAMRGVCFVIRIINDEMVRARLMHIVAEVREIIMELRVAGITLEGNLGRCPIPLNRITIKGGNRNRLASVNRLMSVYL